MKFKVKLKSIVIISVCGRSERSATLGGLKHIQCDSLPYIKLGLVRVFTNTIFYLLILSVCASYSIILHVVSVCASYGIILHVVQM